MDEGRRQTKANCQLLIAVCFFAHSRDLSRRRYTEQKRSFPTLQVVGGRGSWDPNGRPQSTGLQAFPGFPADAALGKSVWIIGEKNTAVNRIFGPGMTTKQYILTNTACGTNRF
jgi:hypothetical protein